MKRILVFVLVALSLLTTWTVSCKHDPVAAPQNIVPDTTDTIISTSCDPDTVYFQNEILPLIQSSCAKSGCHDAATQAEGIYLGTYSSILSGGDIKPGNPNGSKLYEVITQNEPDDIMPPPPSQPLNQQQITLIYQWIQQGALNNYCAELSCDSVNVTFSGQVWPMIQSNCQGCHSGTNPGGNIMLMNYQDVKFYATPKIIGSITHSTGFSPMPKNGNKLPDCKIAQFRRWIDMGTPEN